MILSRKIIFQTFLEYILQLFKEVSLLKLKILIPQSSTSEWNG